MSGASLAIVPAGERVTRSLRPSASGPRRGLPRHTRTCMAFGGPYNYFTVPYDASRSPASKPTAGTGTGSSTASSAPAPAPHQETLPAPAPPNSQASGALGPPPEDEKFVALAWQVRTRSI